MLVAWRRRSLAWAALAYGIPTHLVLDVVTDPEVPPLPPHITLEEARALTSALVHGDVGRRRIIAQSIRQKLPDVFSGR